MISYPVYNRWSGAIQFTAEIDCSADAVRGIKLGLATKWAFRTGADLTGAVLTGAVLTDAVLRGADLRGAVLRGADLTDAVLRGADLTDADLRGADLTDADGASYKVDGRIGIIDAGCPNGWGALGYVDTDSQTLRVHVGCQRREISDGRAYWSSPDHPNRNDRREVLAALDYIEAVARLRGWEGK